MTQVRIWYRDKPDQKLTVTLIHTWRRSDWDIQRGYAMSSSSGPKETLRNDAIAVFERAPTIDAIYYVIARGPMFFILRRGRQHFDITGREIEAEKVTASAGRTERKPAA